MNRYKTFLHNEKGVQYIVNFGPMKAKQTLQKLYLKRNGSIQFIYIDKNGHKYFVIFNKMETKKEQHQQIDEKIEKNVSEPFQPEQYIPNKFNEEILQVNYLKNFK